MNEKLFLFGTGQISKYYTENLKRLSIKIDGYIDNDSKKWGTYFLNSKVYKPNILKEIIEVQILIACSDVKGVTEQLIQMGIQNKIISINYIMKNLQMEIENKNNFKKCTDIRTVIIDNLNGTWGGAEDWAHKITLSLADRKYDMTIIENSEIRAGKDIKQFTKQVDKQNKGFSEIYIDLIDWMIKRKPFILFNIWTSEVLWAACYVKGLYPDQIRIVSVILNDSPDLYERQYNWDNWIDIYLCISSRIKNNLITLYGINEKKVFFKEPFIEKSENIKREYQINNEDPLKICYPCRLVCRQKRADLLPQLIEKLETAGLNYILDIVGDGPCKKEILEYVERNNLSFKIKLHGKLSWVDLKELLDGEDIYLNISEFEGTSLTMLEAMASGCVPVVTDVSGVNDFITNMGNGLISRIGDIKTVVDNIIYLNNNREKLKEFGMESSKIVFSKCNLNKYMNYIERLIETL